MGTIVVRPLRCGCVFLGEAMPGVESAALTFALPIGTARDDEKNLGAGAMLEELLLRGAGDRTSRQLADALDAVGAHRSVEAGAHMLTLGFTTIGDRLRDLLPIARDMVLHPTLADEHVAPVRELCLQALEGLRDDPAHRATLGARARHMPSPLERTGYGTREGLAACDAPTLRAHFQRHARPVGSFVAAAGAIDPNEIADRLDDLLDGWTGTAPELVLNHSAPRGYAHEADDSNQTHIAVYHDAPAEPHEDSVLERLAVGVLSGGMSARLFTEVREKRGLCYSVHASYRPDKELGVGAAQVGTTPQRAQESLDVLLGELERINTPAGAITPEEFARARVGLTSRIVFAGESTSARTLSLVGDQRRLGRPRSLEEMTERIDRVTLEDLNAYLARRSLGRLTIQTVGPEPLTPPG